MSWLIYNIESQACKACSPVGSNPDCRCRGPEFKPQPGHIIFVEVDYEIISMADSRTFKGSCQLLVKVCALSNGYPLKRSKPALEQCE